MKSVASKRRSETAVRFGYKMVCLAGSIAGNLAARLISRAAFSFRSARPRRCVQAAPARIAREKKEADVTHGFNE